MAAEAVHIVGKVNPWRGASSENVNIGLDPRCVVIRTSVNELHLGETLQGDAKAGTTSRTECVVQQPSMIRRAIREYAWRTFEGDCLVQKDCFYRKCTTRCALAHRTMANCGLDRRAHGAKPYRTALTAAFVHLLLRVSPIGHRSIAPPATTSSPDRSPKSCSAGTLPDDCAC